MPVIQLHAGPVAKEKKPEVIAALTKAAAESLGIAESAFTVLIHENPHENIGIGGKPLTEVLKARKK